MTSFEVEVYSEDTVYHANTIYSNHTVSEKGSLPGPIFEVPGLEPGRNYRLLLYAINAKGKSDPVVLEPITLKGVAMYTTGESALISLILLIVARLGGLPVFQSLPHELFML